MVDNTVDEGRVEIELTSNEPARRHRRTTHRSELPPEVAAPAAPRTQSLVADPARTEPAARPPGRNRLIGIAAGAGVAGLLVGWLAGRDGGTLESAATVTTVIAAGSAPPPSFGDDASLVELGAPVLTTAADRERLASTTSPAVESHLLALDSRLLGLPYEIVTAGAGGEIQYIDLARGMITIVDGAAGADTGMLFVGDTWILVPSGSTGDALVYEDGGAAPRRIEHVEPWGILSIPGSPTLWMPDDNVRMNRPGQMIEVGPDLEPTGVRIDVAASPVMIEPPGNFIVPAAGGVYVVSGDGISRLTTGRLIALGPTAALAEECDEQLLCKYVVIDRATGARRDLPGLVRGAPLESVGWWAQNSATVSPDGRLAMVLLPTSHRDPYGGSTVTPRLAAVDLMTGQTTPLTEEAGGIQSAVHWTADSQFAFFMIDGDVFAYVAASGELLRAAPDAVSTMRAQAFSLRPSAKTPLEQRSQLDDGPGDTVAEPTSTP